jgi:membrane fusion protein (multidrug efflux system)
MKKLIYLLVAALGLGGLGWFGYTKQRATGSFGFELGSLGKSAEGAAKGDGAKGDGAKGDGAKGDGAKGDGAGKGAPGSGGAAPGPGGPPRPVGVEAAKVVVESIAEEAVAAGSLRANESVTVRSEVAGRITQVGFTDGARVTRGTTLFALDASLSAAEVEQARAELALAKANFERTAELARRNFVSESAKDTAAANQKVLEAKLKLAEARLARSEIRAPFNGVMGLRNISPGDFVKDGADLALIEDISKMKVDVRLPERYFGRIKPGQPIMLSFDSMPGKTFTATLKAVDAQVDANGRSLLLRGELANPGGALRTGMYARARVLLRENPQAMLIPEEAITPVGADVFVYRIDGGKAMRTKIQTGIRRDGKVEVTSGLQPGDQVVSAGQLRLPRDGMEVRVIDPSRRGPGAGAGPAGGAPGGAPTGPGQGAGPSAGQAPASGGAGVGAPTPAAAAPGAAAPAASPGAPAPAPAAPQAPAK